jgi:hypothetical protein
LEVHEVSKRPSNACQILPVFEYAFVVKVLPMLLPYTMSDDQYGDHAFATFEDALTMYTFGVPYDGSLFQYVPGEENARQAFAVFDVAAALNSVTILVSFAVSHPLLSPLVAFHGNVTNVFDEARTL